MNQPAAAPPESFGPFFSLWTPAELAAAVGDHERAPQARWAAVAVVLILWYWAFANRTLPFCQLLYRSWHLVLALAAKEGTKVSARAVSPEALVQARAALGLAPFAKLFALANERVEREFDELRTYRGLRLSAVDATHLNLCSRRELEREFGRPASTGQQRSPPQAQLVTLDWVLLGWFYDWRVARYDAAELALARELCRRLGHGDLLLADRLYFDPHWFVVLDRRGVKFFFRATADRWRSLTKAARRRVERQRRQARGHVDLWGELHVRDPLSGRRTGTLRVRYLEIPQLGRETLRFFTNLPADFLPPAEAVKLYFQRWEIETDYRLFKGPDHLPVVRSRKPQTVRQEILLRLLAHNSVRYVQALACQRWRHLHPVAATPVLPSPPSATWRTRQRQQGRPLLPVDLQTGQTTAILLGHIAHLAVAGPRGLPERLESLLDDVLRHPIYAQPNRAYPRRGRKFQKGRRHRGNRRAQRLRRRGRRSQRPPVPVPAHET